MAGWRDHFIGGVGSSLAESTINCTLSRIIIKSGGGRDHTLATPRFQCANLGGKDGRHGRDDLKNRDRRGKTGHDVKRGPIGGFRNHRGNNEPAKDGGSTQAAKRLSEKKPEGKNGGEDLSS